MVVSVQGGGNEPRDPGLLEELHPEVEIHRVPCLEPDNFSNSWEQPGQKVVRNLFKTFDFVLVPDDRALWIQPAKRTAVHLIRRYGAEAIIATAQPWSTLMAAAQAQEKTGVPLVLDFRDDWTTSNQDFRRRRPKRQKQEEKMEQEVLKRARAVVSVTPPIVEQLRLRAPANLGADDFHYIPNGFDPEHFQDRPEPEEGKFSILHAGIVHPQRTVAPFFRGVERWLELHPERKEQLQIRFPGRIAAASEPEFEGWSFGDRIERPGFLPHRQIRQMMMRSSLLLLLMEPVKTIEWLFTGKVFEYLGARRPILLLGPTRGPLCDLLEESGIGYCAEHDDADRIAEILEQVHQSGPKAAPREEVIQRFDARAQTGLLAELLNEITQPGVAPENP